MDRRFHLNGDRDRQLALFDATRWVEGDVASRAPELVRTFARYGVDPERILDRHALTEAELIRLAESRVVTIGGHGRTHRPIASLPYEVAEKEISGNRQYLERLIGRDIRHFAYPHGDSAACTWRDAKIVRRSGYRSALTTRRGNLFACHSKEPFMLPRGAMNPRREHVCHVDAQLAGLHRLLESRAGDPVHPDTVPKIGRTT
jgi:peptidoglycan/xylan/chitin deacetylase (PgdA/CDA1 family)